MRNSYIVVPIYLAFYVGWKIYTRCPFVKASEADLWSGKASIDAEIWPEQVPRNFLEVCNASLSQFWDTC